MPDRQPAPFYSSQAALRNREPIADILRSVLPETGKVLEIASGSGEHALYFAQQFPQLLWQPTDQEDAALASIIAWAEHSDLPNLLSPIKLDAMQPESWPQIEAVSAILCINMVHISPWAATEGLIKGASGQLGPYEPFVLYGPYIRADVDTAASNLAFDADLKRRNPSWGLRHLEAVQNLAEGHRFMLEQVVDMPSNNITAIFRKKPDA